MKYAALFLVWIANLCENGERVRKLFCLGVVFVGVDWAKIMRKFERRFAVSYDFIAKMCEKGEKEAKIERALRCFFLLTADCYL